MRMNIAANLAGRVWGAGSVYLFVPLYVKFVGIESYGLIGFYSTLLVVLAFADLGFTATLNREMARLSARSDSIREMRDLLRTYEVSYAVISTLLVVVIWFAAPLLAQDWLRSDILTSTDIAKTLRLMGIAIAFQLPSGLYVGGLMGLQRQVRVNVLQIAWGGFRGVGAVLVLSHVSATVIAFAVWQVTSNVLYCLAVRWSLWCALFDSRVRPRFRWSVFRVTWQYAASVVGMTMISALLTQADKALVSKMLSLETLGYYTLAGAVAAVPLVVASPIASAISPRLTTLVALNNRASVSDFYHRACEVVGAVVIPGGMTISLFAGDFIFAWTGSLTTAHRAGLIASVALGGQLVQAVSLVPYYLAVAHGDLRLYLRIGVASVVASVPLLIVLISRLGALGAALSWFAMNLAGLPVWIYFLHQQFLPGEALRWCRRSLARPLLTALPIVVMCRWLLPHYSSRLWSLAVIAMVWVLSTAVAAAFVSELRGLLGRAVDQWSRASYDTAN